MRCSSPGTRSPCRRTGTRRCLRTSPDASSTASCSTSSTWRRSSSRRWASRPRRRTDTRRTTSSPPRSRFEEARGGTALVASGDRDTFQLVSERTIVLQPQVGGGPLARIGPAEVRERYGVEAAQVPDFIALRGDPSDQIPGARGVGAKTAASVLAQYGSLEAALEEGRFAAEADALRLYRHIATMDRDAPLPPLDDQQPTWAAAAALAARVGSRTPQRAGWRRCRPPDESGARASSTRRATIPSGRTGCWCSTARRSSGRRRTSSSSASTNPPTWSCCRPIDRPVAARRGHRRLEDVLAGGDARGRDRARSRRPRRLRARPAARASRARRPRDGLLPPEQRRRRRPLRAGRARARSGSRSSTSTSTTATAPRQLFRGDDTVLLRLAAPVAVLAGHGRAGHERRVDAERSAACGLAATTSTARRSRPRSSRPCGRSSPDLVLVSAGFDAHADDPLAADGGDGGRASGSSPRRCAALGPRVAAVLEGGYNLETLPGLVAAAHRGFTDS